MVNKSWVLAVLLATVVEGSIIRVRQDSGMPEAPTASIPGAEPTGGAPSGPPSAAPTGTPEVQPGFPELPGGGNGTVPEVPGGGNNTSPDQPGGGAGGDGAAWSQCGGLDFSGSTTCSEGTCIEMNEYYSQCIPEEVQQPAPGQGGDGGNGGGEGGAPQPTAPEQGGPEPTGGAPDDAPSGAPDSGAPSSSAAADEQPSASAEPEAPEPTQ